MKTKYTKNATYRGQNGQVRPGEDIYTTPIINWSALWSRLWLFLKRTVAEVWYLVSRRQPSQRSQQYARTTAYANNPSPVMVLLRSWSWPLLKVTTALVLFFYVMQRDVQFSIEMKAPLGKAVAQQVEGVDVQQMGFAQSVSLGGTRAADEAPLDIAAVDDYLDRFAGVAQAEMVKYGIPASIQMAQAIYASRAGQAVAAKVDNNHFGAHLAAGQPYESAWRNWREHSLLLINRFGKLRRFGNDYRAWARGLEEAGYSKSNNYANELLELIDRFHLEQLDESTI